MSDWPIEPMTIKQQKKIARQNKSSKPNNPKIPWSSLEKQRASGASKRRESFMDLKIMPNSSRQKIPRTSARFKDHPNTKISTVCCRQEIERGNRF